MSDRRFRKTVRYLAYLPWPVSEESAAAATVMGLGWKQLRSSGFATGAKVEPDLARMSAQPDGELATVEVHLVDRADGDESQDRVGFEEEARAAYLAVGEELLGPVGQHETLDGGTADSWLLPSGASVSLLSTPETMILRIASPREGRAELARQVAAD